MTSTSSPAPSRTSIRLDLGWTAVLLKPLPGSGVLGVGVYRAGKLVELVHDPLDVDALVAALTRRLPSAFCGRP
jgi:hypothetical protein